jgi:16S rRNA processing protein RimM
MDIYTEFPERLAPGVTVFVGSNYQPLQISKTRPHSRGMLLGFEGYQSRDEIAELRNMLVQVRTADRPELPEGDYYHHQLLGLRVVDDNGAGLGSITAIIETGANDVYVIRSESGEEILIPAIESVVKDIDLENNQVTIHLLSGLMPGE